MTTTEPDTLCAACGCRYADHCRKCGCRTRAGTADECLCARFVETIPTCPHCGRMFGDRWRLQNHLAPTPTCLHGARAAAGRFATPPSSEPPLRAHRDKYARS